MIAYPKYKDSGVEWLGEIPEHWQIKPLKYAVQINSEVLPENTNEEYEIDYIDIGYVTLGKPITNLQRFQFKDAPSRARRIIKKGDTLVSTVRTYLKAITFIEDNRDNLIASTGFAVIRPLKTYVSKYFSYLMTSEKIVDTICANSVGVSYPAVTASVIGNLPIWLPEHKEQKAIATYLDHKTTQIDSLIEKKKKMIELLKEERAAIINRTVTKGIDPDAEMKDSGIEWLGEVPKHWRIKPLKHLVEINSETLPETTEEDYELEYIDIGNVTLHEPIVNLQHFTFKGAPSRARRILKRGDTIISTVRTYLKAITYIEADIPNLIGSTGFAVIRPPKNFNSKYFSFLMTSEKVIDTICANSVGVSYPAVTATVIGNLPIWLPPFEEQCEITQFLEKKFTAISNSIKKISNEITLIEEYRTALINEAVTGKIDVRENV